MRQKSIRVELMIWVFNFTFNNQLLYCHCQFYLLSKSEKILVGTDCIGRSKDHTNHATTTPVVLDVG